MSLLQRLETMIDVSGRWLGWLNLLMVFGTLVIVILRYLFNEGSILLQESVMYVHAIVFMLGMAVTFKSDDHVRVDVLYQRFSERGQHWVNLLGGLLLLLPMMGFILWECLDYVALSWRTQEASQETGGLPYVYLLKTLIPMMVVLLSLQAILGIIRHAQALRSIPKEQPSS